MTLSLPERIVEKVAGRARTDRRGFLRGATLAGAALAVNPWSYLTRPASAYDAVCGSHNTCSSGYTVFCCTINGGQNTCPPNSFVAGWWKADNASFCGGAARYYIDCNSWRGDNTYPCRCNNSPGTCDNRLVNCNQFRYGQCNTHIPWESTGPVLCRLVSCTPPWQEYGGQCSTASRTDNNTTSHSAPCVNGRPPFGTIDTVTSSGNTVRLTGWAVDMDQPGTSINVALYVDGAGVSWYPTNQPRADVNAALGIGGNHGFDIRVQVPNGVHEFTVYAISVGPDAGRNPALASTRHHVNPGQSPTGRIESVTSTGNRVRVSGWALDRDEPSTSIQVALYVDGGGIRWYPTNVNRPDVNAAFGVTGAHGYDIALDVPNGVHRFDVYAIAVGPDAGRNPLLDSRTVEVNPGAAPRGRVDVASATGNHVRLAGWAYDPDRPDDEIQVMVYEDGTGVGVFGTGTARPDVNAQFGISGRHGFDIHINTSPGVRTFTVYALNVGGGSVSPVIGQATLGVGQAGPIGHLDSATAVGRSIRARGWALDQQVPGEEIQVSLHLDGRQVGRYPTGQPRPDVREALGSTGNPGFDVSISAGPGTHTVTAYAVGRNGQPYIGSRTVVVQ